MQQLLHFFLYALLVTDIQEPCVSPIITEASGESVESVFVSWLDFGNEPGTTLYDLEFVPSASDPTGLPTVDHITGITATVTGLLSGTEYDIYIRAICTEGPSEWNGPVKATTHIENGDACGISLAIPDDNCPDIRSFAINIDTFVGLVLGTDLYLSSVYLIVEHPWMADLTLALRSPSGKSVILMSNRGVGVQDIGDPHDTTCTQSLRFTMSACIDLSDIESGQTGEVLPDGSLNIFHDQGNANGTWYLDICDKASDDIGHLRFAQLNFTENACDFPPDLDVLQVLDTTATLGGLGDENCDTLLLRVWDLSSSADTMQILIECITEDILINQLLPGRSYGYSAQKICGDHRSAWSCPRGISTTCGNISLWSGFNDNADCNPECASPCPLADTLWMNSVEDDMDWTAYQGETPTEFTGPNGTRFTGGKYLYTESSGEECQDSAEAILISRCLRISGSEGGCDMSFWYHMNGPSTGSVSVAISVDGGSVWEELLTISGDQGDAWHQASINLFNYTDTLAILRISTISGPGFLGDIAIDDIMFFGTINGAGIERTFYHDADLDGYGNPHDTICVCALAPPQGYTTNKSDCDDNDPEINPDAEELPCNLRDDNCNAQIDEGENPDPVDYILTEREDASCTGIGDGEIEIIATGGLAPYTFEWSNGGDSSFVSNLSPGLYQATITDANGCLGVTETFEIESVIDVEYFIVTASDPSCIGRSDGFISGIVQGGSEPYEFIWNTGDNTQDINGLPDGEYQVTVTDAQGCWLVSESVTLEAPSTISVSIIQLRHVSCHGGNNGFIRLGVAGGGIPPFSYQWSNGDTTALTLNLTAGSYTCTIMDSTGCMIVAGPYVITEPAELEVQVVSLIPPLCNSGDDGSIELSVNGGTSPYFYTWGHGAFSEDVFQLTEGDYSVTVTDIRGCDTILDIALVSPDMLELTLDTAINVQCPGDSTGSIVVNASGGTPPYRYDWSTGATDRTSVEGLPTGLYSVTLSDAFGCKSSIRDIPVIAINAPLQISFDSVQQVDCHGDSSGFVTAYVVGGTPPFFFNWSAGTQHISLDGKDTLQSLPAGNYQVTITDATGCVGMSGKAIITQPTRLTFVLDELMHNICFGDNLGTIDMAVEGGTMPYSYLWTNGEVTEDLINLHAGVYQLVVTDNLGCWIATQTFEIDEPDAININFETADEMGMMANGWAEVFVSGGTPPYTYLWDTIAGSQSTALAIDLSSATYNVTITDAVGCEYVASVFVDRSTSVEDEEESAIRIYPNPADNYVIIESDNRIESVMIYGIDGRLRDLVSEELAQNSLRIDVRSFPPGLYILRVNGQVRKVLVV